MTTTDTEQEIARLRAKNGKPPREPRTASTTGFYGSTTQGLARFEVDTQTRTLVTKPMLTSLMPTSPAHNWQYDVAYERSVQIESFVYYLSGGSFRSASW